MNDYSIIGIDYGTSATVVKVKNYYDGMQESSCESLCIDGSYTIPTVVFERADGKCFFGQEAISEQSTFVEGKLYQNFKMDLINADASVRSKAEELTKKFFKYLYEEFDKQRSVLHVFNKTKTYVSYPAKWTPDVVRFMKSCAIEAGFGTESNVFGETEPTAAIFATFENHHDQIKEQRLVVQEQPINVMMIDMGAGTSDVTIFKFKVDKNNKFFVGFDEQIITYPTVDNSYLCGGREIDELLLKYVMQYVSAAIKPEFKTMTGQIESTMRNAVKTWKENNVSASLARKESIGKPGALNLYLQMGFFKESAVYPDLNCSRFELLTYEHWKQLYDLIVGAINRARSVIKGLNGPENIDLVILTGGHSQWYLIDDLFLGKQLYRDLPALGFKKISANPLRLIQEERPQETVANGLIYRDLSFEVAHTASNSIWAQITLGNTKSKTYCLVKSNDSLPFNKSYDVFQITIDDHTFSTKEVEVRCDLWIGGSMSTAKHLFQTRKFSINDFFMAMLGLPFRLILAIILWLFGNGENPFADNFVISATPRVTIDDDGSGKFYLSYQSNYSPGNTMEFDI